MTALAAMPRPVPLGCAVVQADAAATVIAFRLSDLTAIPEIFADIDRPGFRLTATVTARDEAVALRLILSQAVALAELLQVGLGRATGPVTIQVWAGSQAATVTPHCRFAFDLPLADMLAEVARLDAATILAGPARRVPLIQDD